MMDGSYLIYLDRVSGSLGAKPEPRIAESRAGAPLTIALFLLLGLFGQMLAGVSLSAETTNRDRDLRAAFQQ